MMTARTFILWGLASSAVALAFWACSGSKDNGFYPLDGGDAQADAGPDTSVPDAASGGSASGGSTGSGGSGGSAQVPCRSQSDCPPELPVCNHASDLCVECVSDLQCGEGGSCEDSVCIRPTTCNEHADCANEPLGRTVCDSEVGICVGCVSFAHCASGEICRDGECQTPASCSSSLDCDGLVCVAGECLPCQTSNDCTEGVCLDNHCVPTCSSDVQCTRYGLLCDTGNGNCVRCKEHEHCPSAQFCLNGLCVDDVCPQGETTCDGNTVTGCNTVGSGTSTTPCASRQTCVESGTSASCEDWVCTAGQTECLNNAIVECAADGLSALSSVPCGSQICWQASCQDLTCAPDSLQCAGDEVQQCNSIGTAFSVIDTCEADEFCDTNDPQCKPLLCVPNGATCDGNRATTCNGTGTGYLAGGTDCGSQVCVSGSCEDWLFFDDFEDGDYNGWTQAGAGYSYSVVNTVAANGSTRSLELIGGNTDHSDGLEHAFADLQPTYVSYWGMSSSTSNHDTYFVMQSESTSNIAFIYFTGYGVIRIAGPNVDAPYVANQWYHIELRNIDWVSDDFDFYVNGALVQASVPFRSSATSLSRIDLYNYNYSTGHWDEIGLR